jgi:hypothetical protein
MFFRFALSALAAFFVGSLFYVARSEDEAPRCSEEIFNVSNEMLRNYGLNVDQPSSEPVAEKANPYPGSQARYFWMITRYNDESPYVRKATFNAENFMNSTGIQLRLAKRLMEACPSTSKVGFGFAGSSYAIYYYRMPSGVIRQGVPIDCGRGNSNDDKVLQWGYYHSC